MRSTPTVPTVNASPTTGYRDDDYRKRKRKGLLGDLFDFD